MTGSQDLRGAFNLQFERDGASGPDLLIGRYPITLTVEVERGEVCGDSLSRYKAPDRLKGYTVSLPLPKQFAHQLAGSHSTFQFDVDHDVHRCRWFFERVYWEIGDRWVGTIYREARGTSEWVCGPSRNAYLRKIHPNKNHMVSWWTIEKHNLKNGFSISC